MPSPKSCFRHKNFQKIVGKTIETKAFCFKKQWPIVCPPKFFSGRKPALCVDLELGCNFKLVLGKGNVQKLEELSNQSLIIITFQSRTRN